MVNSRAETFALRLSERVPLPYTRQDRGRRLKTYTRGPALPLRKGQRIGSLLMQQGC